MLTLVFDTETTGVPPKDFNASLEKCPWIIQLAAILYNERKPVAHFSTYVQPEHEGMKGTIPNEKFWIENHLTEPEIMPSALSLHDALRMFGRLATVADRVVAHNFNFDRRQMDFSCRRVYGSPAMWDFPCVCTMMSSMPIVAIPSKFPKPHEPYKWPTLDEAYRKLVNPNGFSGAHDALADCMACAEVLFSLEDAGHSLVLL